MTISRRHLLKTLSISSGGLPAAGCLAPEGGDRKETATATATTGWATEIPETRPDVSCSAISRPMAESVDREMALSPREYPGPPPLEPADEAAVEYVTAFEGAYRQNAEMEANNDVANDRYLMRFDISIQNSWVAAGPSDSSVVRLEYIGSGAIHSGSEFDYVTQYVTYYVDSTRVVRARTTQYDFAGTDAFDPDPWADGDPVACFEG